MSSKAANVTLSGCLREGSTANTFELQNVHMADSSAMSPGERHPDTAGSSAAPSSTAGQTSPSGTGASTGMSGGTPGSDMGPVTLLASADIDLKEHVGHQVEVRGTLSGGPSKTKDKGTGSASDTMGSGSSASSTSATGSSGTGTTGTAGADSAKNAHALKVRSLRHVSDSCSQ
jgi:hypothetical protein